MVRPLGPVGICLEVRLAEDLISADGSIVLTFWGHENTDAAMVQHEVTGADL